MGMLTSRPEPPKKGPINVALYVRVSTDKQAQKEDGSLDTQIDRLTAFVEYKRSQGEDWTVVERFIEGEKDGRRHGRSGKDTDRPALQRLRDMAQAKLIDVVVITKIDRISRSVIDFLLLVEELDRHGVKVVSLRESIDLTTPVGKFQTILMIALAQHEREVIAARVREKVAWRAEKGLPLGRPPIGYAMKGKMYEIDETFAEHVRAADALYLERESADAVVVEFRKRGYRTPSGGCYTKPMICRMLRSPVYAAKLAYQGNVFDAQWKPIRVWDTHQRIQKIMDRNRTHNGSALRQSEEHVYLLQGLLRCGSCGHKMSPKSGTGRSGAAYPYYTCGYAEKSKGFDCQFQYVPAVSLDRAFMDFLRQLSIKPEQLQEMARQSRESRLETIAKIRRDLERVQEQLGSVRSKLSHLADAVADGGKAVLATLRPKIEAFDAEREELEAAEARLKSDLASERSHEIAVEDHARTLALFHNLVEKNDAKPDRIKLLVRSFVEYVVWHTTEGGDCKLEVALLAEPVAAAPTVVAELAPQSPGRRFATGYQMVPPPGFEPGTPRLAIECSIL